MYPTVRVLTFFYPMNVHSNIIPVFHARIIYIYRAAFKTKQSWLGTTKPTASLVGGDPQTESETEAGSLNSKLKVSGSLKLST